MTADIVFPVTGPESFIDPVRLVLESQVAAGTLGNIRIAVISHISAYPSVVLPVESLVSLFHEYNIPVVVDGAHALGNIEINLQKRGHLDYYFANAHKWLFSSKSAAVMYVRNDHQQLYVPAPMLIDSPETNSFTDRFIWTGTRDRTAFCAISAALDFRSSLGGELAIMDYNQRQASMGGTYLVNYWHSRLLGPMDMMSSMVSVQVPTDSLSACQTVRSQLCSQYDICVSASVSYTIAGSNIPCYWRLSAQVYLEMSDWVALGHHTVELLSALNAMKSPEELGFTHTPLPIISS
jgi:selenocysteine lyase/cysteine desulfurase